MLTNKALRQNTLVPSFQALSITDLILNIREDCNYFSEKMNLNELIFVITAMGEILLRSRTENGNYVTHRMKYHE